jgi:hypothetical protein
MPLYVWLALLVGLVALFAGPSLAAVRGWRMVNSFKRLAGQAGELVDDVSRSAATVEQRALAATEGAERLSVAVARLEVSLAELQVLKAAADETRSGLSRLTSLRPRK